MDEESGLPNLDSDSNQWLDEDVIQGHTYYYRITALREDGTLSAPTFTVAGGMGISYDW